MTHTTTVAAQPHEATATGLVTSIGIFFPVFHHLAPLVVTEQPSSNQTRYASHCNCEPLKEEAYIPTVAMFLKLG